MLLSDEKGFIFVHVPKSGGTSVSAALAPFALARPKGRLASLLRPLGLPRDYRRYRFPKHGSLALVQRRLPPSLFDAYFKFAFVRNPWDRLVSDWNAVREDPTHRRHTLLVDVDFPDYVRRLAPRWLPPQRDLLVDAAGQLATDYVGRLENLAADFEHVCRRLGLEASLPQLNAHEHPGYREFYDARTREFVEQQWGADVREFGYQF